MSERELRERAFWEELWSAERACRSAIRTAREHLDDMESLVDDPDNCVGHRTAEPVRAAAVAVEALARLVTMRTVIAIMSVRAPRGSARAKQPGTADDSAEDAG